MRVAEFLEVLERLEPKPADFPTFDLVAEYGDEDTPILGIRWSRGALRFEVADELGPDKKARTELEEAQYERDEAQSRTWELEHEVDILREEVAKLKAELEKAVVTK